MSAGRAVTAHAELVAFGSGRNAIERIVGSGFA